MNTEGKSTFIREELVALNPDIKRMLRVQLKELIHAVEDVEFDMGSAYNPLFEQSIISRDNAITTNVA